MKKKNMKLNIKFYYKNLMNYKKIILVLLMK